jgi:hypothetical protein
MTHIFTNLSRGQFHQHIGTTFLHKQDEKLFWQMAFGNWLIILLNFTIQSVQISSAQNVGEIEWQIVWQMLCAGYFLLGFQRLVKFTPAVNFVNILRAHFCTKIHSKPNSKQRKDFPTKNAHVKC